MDEAIAPIIAAITAALTAGFVGLLYIQTMRQRVEHNLTIRPIIVLDKDHPLKAITVTTQKEKPRITIRLINVGKIHTARARIILLPPDRYSEFMEREKALGKYFNEIGEGNLRKTDSCILQRPIREREKGDPEERSSQYYLILGDDFKRLNPAVKEFENLSNSMGDEKKRKEFEDAGRDRAASMAKFSPKDWNAFYLSGEKRGDFLDKIGPADWEVFDDELGRDRLHELLGDMADEVYKTAPVRARILSKMNKSDRERFDIAIKKRLGVWGVLQDEVLEEFARTSMNVRKIYRDIKDVFSLTTNMLAPNHPIEMVWHLNEKNLKDIKSEEYLYFGVLVQYSKPEGKGMEYSYYLRGYIEKGEAQIDEILD